ncbi:16S rRNA (cytosine(967)-C(5))-methyltransferase, partial [Pectobacterium versatile]|nr:16S rRNA (cytosine(967)-C(5))-methyltransferase [Pectobacterium versatile]
HHTRKAYLDLLAQEGIEAFAHPEYADAIRLASPCAVDLLPGFAQGWATIQDASAQGCVYWLEPQDGEQILDLCAAPG